MSEPAALTRALVRAGLTQARYVLVIDGDRLDGVFGIDGVEENADGTTTLHMKRARNNERPAQHEG